MELTIYNKETEEKMIQIPEALLKRLITNLWYQDPDLDDVTELSKNLIDEFPEMFVDLMEDDGRVYICTKPAWLNDDDKANNIFAPQNNVGEWTYATQYEPGQDDYEKQKEFNSYPERYEH